MSPARLCGVRGTVNFLGKGRFGEATRVTGKMVQIHRGAATVSGERSSR